MTLWRNFFPEPVLPKASSQELPLGYAGNGSPTRSWTVFEEAWIWGSIDSHIFETGTPISAAKCHTRLTEFHDSTSSVMLAMPVLRGPPCSQRGEMEICSSTSLLSQSPAFPTHRQNDFCVYRDKTTNSVALIPELSSMVSPRRPSFQIPRLAA